MDVTKINYKIYADNAKDVFKNPKLKWKPQLPATFLEHTLPILASVPLKYTDSLVNVHDTLANLVSIEQLKTPNGIMNGINVSRLIMFLYYCKRGDLIYGSQNQHPRLAALTPLFMYAHKLYNNVGYEKWNRHDENIHYILGRFLEPIVKIEEMPKDYNVNDIRELVLTYKTGKKAGITAPLTAYKCNPVEIDGIKLPPVGIIMLLQIWIANASIRNTESMILDPIHWGNVPDPLDAVGPPIQKVKVKEEEEVNPWM